MRIVCIIAALLAPSVTMLGQPSRAFGPVVQSAETQIATRQIDPTVLQQRYQKIWASIGGEVPSLVVHLGASAGNQITAWAKSANGRNAGPRNWGLACAGTDAVSVHEEVHDPRFGISKLAIARKDGNAAPLSCNISMGGNSAEVVIPVLPPSLKQGRFSFLAYSCNEPFNSEYGGGILARDLSLWLRMDARATGENSRGQLPERPQFVLGVGDQIYVDPDPDAEQPLAFFKGDRSNQFLVHPDRGSLYSAFDVVYRYNFSLPPLAQAFSKLPSFMMWDDHEIRDGWGSQGDELSQPMSDYFEIARHAFIAHQLLRSYAPATIDQRAYDALLAGRQPLHFSFSHGDRTHVLMLDSRSTRGPNSSIIDGIALQAVQDWLARGRKGQGDLYVLTVGLPLFPSRNITSAGRHNIDDDLRDSWDSDQNAPSRASLLSMLASHFEADITDRLLVLSGDVHYSSLYFLSLNGRVVGQEVVTSGIAHSLPSRARKLNWLLDSANLVGRFGVMPAGKINDSASFAELIVDPGPPNRAPQVDLVFHANGTRVNRRGWALGNTNLLAPGNSPLWYHTYRYDYTDALEHLVMARSKADPAGDTAAGTVMPLPLERPRVRTKRPFVLWPFRRNTVQSAIQAQSVFCTVPGTEYNTTVARSWDLVELRGSCVRLRQ